MATTASSARVQARPDEVWAVLATFGDISRWGRGVTHSTLLTSGPIGPGSVRRVQVGRVALRETIVRWEPGEALGYTIAGLPPIVQSATNTWTLAAVDGGTEITLTSEVATRGGPVVARLVGRRLGDAGRDLVAGLVDDLSGTDGAQQRQGEER